MIIFLVFAIALTVWASDSPPALNNIGYLGYGYNQFTGNPHDDGFDPGLTVPVFNTSIYSKKRTNTDRSFSIPDGVDAHRASSCNSASVSKEILDENDLCSILQNSFEAHFIGVPFSANAKFQRIRKRCRENRDVFVDSVSTCEQYAARILMYDPPPLTSDFLSAVAELPTQYENDTREKFINFLKNFGTHVVTKMWMGSKLIRTYRMSGSEFAELLGLGFNVKLAAKIHTGNAMGKFKIKTAFQNSQELQSFLEQHLILEDLIGTPEDAPSDFANKWFPMRLNEPSPVRYSLTKISEFVGEHKQDAVEEAISQICHFINAQCEPETPLPQPIPICPSVKFNLDKTKHTAPCTYGISIKQHAHPKLVCPDDYVLTGVQLSVGRTLGHLRFNVGCSTRFDISLEPVYWVSPVPAPDKMRDGIRTSLVTCPKGHFATGISFARSCFPSSRPRTFASLQCSRSSQPIRQISFTEWSELPMPLAPLYSYLACHDGGIVCGIEFQGQKDDAWANQAYRLQCCYVGSKCVSRYPALKTDLQLPSEENRITDPIDPNEDSQFFSARLSLNETNEKFFSARMQVDLGRVQFFSSRYFDVKDKIIEQAEDEMEDAEPLFPDELFNGEITIESNKFANDIMGWY